MMLIGWLPSLAHDFEVDGIYYNKINDTEVEVTYKGSSYDYSREYIDDIVIPSSVDYEGVTYSVTKIGASAFRSCVDMTSIEIPNSITSISNWAFCSCSDLTSIKIPNSIISIGEGAFSKCSSLTSILVDAGNSIYDSRNDCNAIIETASNTLIAGCQNTVIPNSITSIGNYAFKGCTSLRSIEIPNSVTSIGKEAFYYCPNLTSIEIPNNVTDIEEDAFRLCLELTSIVVDAGNTVYDSRENCNAIIETATNKLIRGCQNSKIPNSVISIGEAAFESCPKLTSIEIPNSVTSIGNYAFESCSGLTSVEIPNSVTSIGLYAFGYCSSLTSIKIGNSVTRIEDGTFQTCTSLKNIEIPNSVISIGKEAFYYCSDLTSIEIPNSVTSIGDWAFSSCSSLTGIEIPNSVTSIGNSAFYDCESLTSIEIPNSVTSIGDFVFSYCSSLISIKLPNSLVTIGKYAFQNCKSLTDIEIPNSVTCIGSYAFEGCTGLTSVVWNSVRCSDFSSNSTHFRNCSNITSFTFGNKVEYIPAYLCYDMSNLASIEIPNSVISIGEGSFSGCTSLKSIEIPNSVTCIESYAFKGCTGLTSIEIPNNIISIGESSFSGCTGLTSVVWNSVRCSDFSHSPFYGCKITSLTFGENVEHIPTYLCYNLSNLTSIEIPNSVISIGERSFYGCTGLTSIEIGNSVTSIGNYAFRGCSSLTKITCLATTPPKIVSNTFSNYSAELHVPSGCKSAYQSAIYWKYFNIKEIVTLSTSIALNQTTATLKATETITLVATVLPENATDKSVTWKSSNEAVATVDANGKVTAVAVGETTITATTADGSNLSASCKVTVIPTLAESITLDKIEISLEATETATLIATILPELTTDKSVEWSSSNEAIAVVDENGVVTAIAIGEATITATTTDGTNLSASCKVTVVPTLGDATNDAVINVTDIMVVASYILGNTPEGFVFEAADVTKDGKINIIDIVAIANIILSSETPDETQLAARVARQAALGSRLFIDDTSIQEGETMQLAVNLTNDIAFSGFQADVKLPEGLELCQEDGEYMISLSDRKGSDHVLTSAMLSDGTIRILSYSMNLNDFAGADGALVYLTVKATQHFVGDYEISIDNITFTQADLTEYSLEPTVCRIAGTTSIEGVDNNVIVVSIGDYIVVKNATVGSVVRVYTADGAMIASEVATEGDVIIEVPAKGIYVVKVGKQTVKVII